MGTATRSVIVEAPDDRTFAYVDDIRNLARHMCEGRLMPMMGSIGDTRRSGAPSANELPRAGKRPVFLVRSMGSENLESAAATRLRAKALRLVAPCAVGNNRCRAML